jgi:hypothetical protein
MKRLMGTVLLSLSIILGVSVVPVSAATHAAMSNSAVCVFEAGVVQNCQSTDPHVVLNLHNTGDTSQCTFAIQVNWGDGSAVQNFTVPGGPNGSEHLSDHVYPASSGIHQIEATGSVASGSCTFSSATYQFTLLAPANPSLCPTGTILSGVSWVKQFPDSKLLSNLSNPFHSEAQLFVATLRAALGKATTPNNPNIISTRRPLQRADLMNYSWRIVSSNKQYHLDPRNVPSIPGVPICWTYTKTDGTYDAQASIAAAQAMVKGYQIDPTLKLPPSLTSNHIKGFAMDMAVSWQGTLTIRDASGTIVTITSSPRTQMNPQLWKVAASYGVYHFGTGNNHAKPPSADQNHWSIDGF